MTAELEEEIDNIEQEDKILTQKIADVKQKLTKESND